PRLRLRAARGRNPRLQVRAAQDRPALRSGVAPAGGTLRAERRVAPLGAAPFAGASAPGHAPEASMPPPHAGAGQTPVAAAPADAARPEREPPGGVPSLLRQRGAGGRGAPGAPVPGSPGARANRSRAGPELASVVPAASRRSPRAVAALAPA